MTLGLPPQREPHEPQCQERPRRGLGNDRGRVEFSHQPSRLEELAFECKVVDLGLGAARYEVRKDKAESSGLPRRKVGLGPDRAAQTTRNIRTCCPRTEVVVVDVVQINQLVSIIEAR